MALKYKRLLVKFSGEQLAGENQGGIDTKLVEWIAQEVKLATDEGAEVVIVVGGGNYVRGVYFKDTGISHVTADYMGMLSGMINALGVADLFSSVGVQARALSNVSVPQLIDDFTPRRALSHLAKGRVVVIAGGIGRPGFTHDTAAVSLALELDCDVVCKITKVDGVYDRDPTKFDDAKKLDKISFQQAVENPDIKIMDKAALGLAMEQNQPILVFDLHTTGNLRRAALGESVGTIVS